MFTNLYGLKSITDILRTESEESDPNFGKLVPANRECEDRAKMLYENIEPWMTDETSWLDIGCNVGWFVFEFATHFDMYGIDFDVREDCICKDDGRGTTIIRYVYAYGREI